MKVNINVPEHLGEITLGQYQRFLNLDLDGKQNSYLFQKVIEIFCDVDLKDIASFRFNSMAEVANDIQNLFAEKTPLIPSFKMNGTTYGMIPKLDDMSLGEYIDLDNYFHDWDTMHKAMTVLFRPLKYKKGDKYLIEQYEAGMDHDKMKQMPLNVVFGAKVFFYNLGNELLNHTLNFLKQEVTGLSVQQRKILEQSGDGIQAFMDLQRGTFPNSTTSHD